MRKTLILPVLLSSLAFSANAADSTPVDSRATDPANIWDLTLLYKDDAAWTAAKDQVASKIPALAAYKGHLGDSPAKFFEAIDTIANLGKDFGRLGTYSHLKLDENTRNSPNLERTQELSLLGTQFSQAVSFFRPEVLSLGEAKLKEFLAAEPRLKVYTFEINNILRNAPHTLGAEAEGVLSSASLVTGTASSLYGILANADMPWPTVKLTDGSDARLDQSGYTRYRSAPNRADREIVFNAFWGKMREYERTFGVALFSQVKADWFRASTRKYPSCLNAALADDNVPEAVYRTLLAETNANLPTLHRYFKLRARMLGISDLRYHDIYPSLVKLDRPFPYSEGSRLAIESSRALGAEYTKMITDAFSGRYTHVYPQPGKRSGAYMSGSVHDAHPYVLMNYNDDYESVSTLAHEWGHGMHSRLANLNQPFQLSDYSIFTAEIASTLNEALLLEHVLKVAKDDDERLYYLGSALEGLRGTFFRQAMFAEFELAIHETVEKGGSLSGAKLNQIYGDILRRYHGHNEGVLKIDDNVTVEWAYIPHFYRGFYVYQYSTSIAASQAFAEKIIAGEKGAVENYLTVLKAGGSDFPYEIVKRAGVDLASPEPYRALVARMNRIMDQIEALLAKKGK